jgi:hypothetical protein
MGLFHLALLLHLHDNLLLHLHGAFLLRLHVHGCCGKRRQWLKFYTLRKRTRPVCTCKKLKRFHTKCMASFYMQKTETSMAVSTRCMQKN